MSGAGTGRNFGTWTPSQRKGAIQKMATWGHAYALHIDNHKDGKITDSRLLAALVDDLNRREIEHAFALGDHVFDPRSEEEWRLVEKELRRFEGSLHYTRGNHEWFPKLPIYDRMREPLEQNYTMVEPLDVKTVGKAVDIGPSRFILFDYRNFYSERDIEFLEHALEGYDQRKATYFMTHLLSFTRRSINEAPDGVDLFKPYAPFSNFNDDIAPLLNQRVDYAMFGDICGQLARHYVAPNGTYYLCNGFTFQGDTPMVYLELQFIEGELYRAIPRIVPVDLRDKWYRYEYLYSYEVHDILQRLEDKPERFVAWLRENYKNVTTNRLWLEGSELTLIGSDRDHYTVYSALSHMRTKLQK